MGPRDGPDGLVRVTDPGHPLFGKTLPLVSVTGSRLARGHVYVSHRGAALLMVPISSTSLRAAAVPEAPRTKLTPDALAELLARIRESEEALPPCESTPTRSGPDCPSRRAAPSSTPSRRRCGR
jgi:hypothetical protein